MVNDLIITSFNSFKENLFYLKYTNIQIDNDT